MDLREVPDVLARRHPWEVARFRFLRRELGQLVARPSRVLDAGAGDAWFSRELLPHLAPGSAITCWDAHYATLPAGGPGLRFTRERPDGPFDLLLLLDVLEHVEDDRAFLGDLVAQLAPGGHALITVPAWQPLFTQHDVALRHFRRYAPDQGARLLQGAGLEIVRKGGLFHSLLLPRLGARLAEAVRGPKAQPGEVGAWSRGPLLTGAVQAALAVDNRVSRALARRRLDMPGLSWWALCRVLDRQP